MRTLKFVAFIVILVESIMAFSFWLGFIWLGGWKGGLFLLLIALMILGLPVIGKLEVECNLLRGITKIKLGWIANIMMSDWTDGEINLRFLFFYWKIRPGSKNGTNKRRYDKMLKTLTLAEITCESLESSIRFLMAFFQALNELISEADVISLKIQAPTQIAEADRFLGIVIGQRSLGTFKLNVVGEGNRELVVRFKIGLLKGILIGLNGYLQSRPKRRLNSVRV